MRIILAGLIAFIFLSLVGCGGGSDVSVAIIVDPSGQSGPSVSGESDAETGLTTGLHSLTSYGVERSFWLQLPSDYSPDGDTRPLIVAFHGTGGSHLNWLAGGIYGDGLINQAGNDAILVFPDALPDQTGTNQWNPLYDFEFFLDLIARIQRDVGYDPNRVFITGQSSGGGFTHEVGCRYGDIVRGIAPVAGALTTSTCIGSAAVLMIQGRKDSIVPATIVFPTREFWVLYNGFELDVFQDAPPPPCIDHSLGASLYPMQWCLHEEGDGPSAHAWPSFADEAIWAFFSGLPEAAPSTDEPPGGGNDRVAQAFTVPLTFTLDYPNEINPVVQLAAVLYDAGTGQPFPGAPEWFLNTDIDPGAAAPGAQVTYEVPVKLPPELPGFFDFPSEYALSITIYVEGGNFPIPVAGIDHSAVIDIEIVDTVSPIFVTTVLPVVPVISDF